MLKTLEQRPDLGTRISSDASRPSKASPRELLLIGALLLTISVLVYGPHVVEGGFAIDDYGHAAAIKYPRDGILQDYWDTFPHRPGLALYIPLPHIAFGPNPALHLALASLHAVLMSLALYAVLRRFRIPAVHSGAIAVLVLLFPWSDSARFWAVAAHISMAITFGLLGLLLALRGLDVQAAGKQARGRWLHLAALSMYALSVLTYEIAGGVLLLVGAAYTTRAAWSVAWRRWIVDILVIVPCLMWTTFRADRPRQSIEQMIDHAVGIANSGLTVVSLAAIPFRNAGQRAGFLADGDLIRDLTLVGLATVVIVAAVVYWRLPSENAVRPTLRLWLLTAVSGMAITVAAWAIYIPGDPYYNPGAEGVGNRVNVMASVGIIVLIYAIAMLGATLLFRSLANWIRVAAVTCLVFAAVLSVSYARDERDEQQAWARADTAADAVIGAIATAVPEPSPGATIYTFGHAGNERGGVPIFGVSWDLKGAIQLNYDDPTLNSYPILEGASMVCSASGVGPVGNGWSLEMHSAPYESAYFVDAATWTGERIDSRQQCQAALHRYAPGPNIRPQ